MNYSLALPSPHQTQLQISDFPDPLSTLKTLHAKAISKSYVFLQTDEGKKIILSGWRGAGITRAVNECREPSWAQLLDPFASFAI